MKAFLVRVAADSTEQGGKFNAPVDVQTNQFVYIPIPEMQESKKVRHGYETVYEPFRIACQSLGVMLPAGLLSKYAHLDPDFEYLTYGDEGRKGRQLKKELGVGDLLVFYAGLRPIQPHKYLVYALVGLFVLERQGVYAKDLPQEYWYMNAHTRRVSKEDDVVFFGRRGLSGRLQRCIPIGTYRRNAYRLDEEILEEWGGLSTSEGYIQRSAYIPQIHDAEKFYAWFKSQNVPLITRNN